MFVAGRSLKSILDMQAFNILNLKLSPCSECCFLSFWAIPLRLNFFFLLFYKIQAPGNHPRERIQQTISTLCSQKLVHIGVCFNSLALLQHFTSFEYVVINYFWPHRGISLWSIWVFTVDLPCLADCPVCTEYTGVVISPCPDPGRKQSTATKTYNTIPRLMAYKQQESCCLYAICLGIVL